MASDSVDRKGRPLHGRPLQDRSLQRIAYIDGLRAVAVLAVVAHHAAKYWLLPGSAPLAHFLMEGSHGVDLFFVISGFCLTYPALLRLHAAGGARFDVAGYFARRVVRIVPPYVAATLAFVLLASVVTSAGYMLPAGAMTPPGAPLDVVRQLLFMDRAGGFVNGSFWTLAIEWRWYFAMPLLLWAWTRSPRLFAVIAAASFVAYHATVLHVIDLAVLPAFMLGIVAAQLAVSGSTWAIVRWAPLLCVLGVAIGVLVEPKTALGFFVQDQLAWQLAAFCFVVAAGNSRPLRAALSSLPLTAIGLASYSIYLVHEPIIALVQELTPYGPLVAVIVALLAGAAFFILFEKPLLGEPARGRAIALARLPIDAVWRWCGFVSGAFDLGRMPAPAVEDRGGLELRTLGLVVDAPAQPSEEHAR